MDFKVVLRLLGKLIMAFAGIVFIPFLAALVYDRDNIHVFAWTLAIAIIMAKTMMYYGSRKSNQRLRLREAIVVVGCGWLLVVVLLTPRMESLRQKVGGGDEVWLGLITCSASIGLFGYMASQYYNKIVVDPAQAWSCIAGTVVMVACVKLSKKMPWLKEYGLGIAIVIGIVVGALVR